MYFSYNTSYNVTMKGVIDMNLLQWRESKGLTQSDVADLLKMSQPGYRKLEQKNLMELKYKYIKALEELDEDIIKEVEAYAY